MQFESLSERNMIWNLERNTLVFDDANGSLCLLYYMFIYLARRSSAALEVNEKPEGRMLNKGKGNIADIVEIQFV